MNMMIEEIVMSRFRIASLFMALLLVLPVSALAEGDWQGSVTVGAETLDIDDKSAKAGEYNGFNAYGDYAIC